MKFFIKRRIRKLQRSIVEREAYLKAYYEPYKEGTADKEIKWDTDIRSYKAELAVLETRLYPITKTRIVNDSGRTANLS